MFSFCSILTLSLAIAVPLPENFPDTATRESVGTTRKDILHRLEKIAVQSGESENKGNDLRDRVCEAAKLLSSEKALPGEFAAPNLGNEQERNQFKSQLGEIQKNAALMQFQLDRALEELDLLQDRRDKETKSWQGNYDYVRARLAARIAQLYEYNLKLGQMRKEFPPLDPMIHTGWRLATGGTVSDRDSGKYAEKAKSYLNKLLESQAGTGWERIAKEELPLLGIGLEWVPVSRK